MLIWGFLIAGICLSGYFAWAGLVRGSVKVSDSSVCTGRTAQLIGMVCLLLLLALLGFVAWIVSQIIK